MVVDKVLKSSQTKHVLFKIIKDKSLTGTNQKCALWRWRGALVFHLLALGQHHVYRGGGSTVWQALAEWCQVAGRQVLQLVHVYHQLVPARKCLLAHLTNVGLFSCVDPHVDHLHNSSGVNSCVNKATGKKWNIL